jgi:hypothetical protein
MRRILDKLFALESEFSKKELRDVTVWQTGNADRVADAVLIPACLGFLTGAVGCYFLAPDLVRMLVVATFTPASLSTGISYALGRRYSGRTLPQLLSLNLT